MEGVDLSALGSGTLVGTGNTNTLLTAVNCRLGSGFVAGTPAPGSNIDLINTTSGALNYAHSRTRAEGSHVYTTGIVRTGGATDFLENRNHRRCRVLNGI